MEPIVTTFAIAVSVAIVLGGLVLLADVAGDG